MPLHITTADDVVAEVELATRPVMERLARDDLWLHEQGYHSWSVVMANLRTDIETAQHKAIDALAEE